MKKQIHNFAPSNHTLIKYKILPHKVKKLLNRFEIRAFYVSVWYNIQGVKSKKYRSDMRASYFYGRL